MASPCVGTRVSPSKSNTPLYSQNHFVAGTIQTEHPLEFRIPRSNAKACGHPKHANSRTKNGVAPESRRLGSIRSALISSGYNSEAVIDESEPLVLARSNLSILKQKSGSNSFSNSTDGSSRHGDYGRGGKSKTKHLSNPNRQQQKDLTSSSNSSLLTNSGHKKVDAFSMSSFHEQTVPDARRDPYNVHKWRRKSSRRKYAGMESSPILAQRLKQDAEYRKATGISEFGELLPEDRAMKFLSELTRKPKVPLPGRNMLPSLHVHPRSETGNSGREEISLRFARNMAMEELEKRFHDSRYKTKHIRSSLHKETMKEPLGNARLEYIRNASHHRAGHLLPIQNRYRQDVVHTNSVIDSSATSPAKNSLHGHERDNEDFSKDGVAKITTSNDGIVGELDPSIKPITESQVVLRNDGIMSDAIKFKVFDESFSEETVTIISKPSESASQTKYGDSKISKLFNASTLQDQRMAEQTLHKGNAKSEHIVKDLSTMAYALPDKRYQTSSNFANDVSSQYPDNENIHRVKKLPGVSNRNDKCTKSSQNNQKSLRYETHANNTFDKRVILPPITSVASRTHNDDNSDRKRTRQKVTMQLTGVATLSPRVRSPLSKKSVSSKTSPLSYASNSSFGVKDSNTPVDSMGSQSTAGGGRRKSRKWRRFSRRESKGSPQFQKALKQSKVAKLMGRWRIVVKTVIMINRLYSEHHIVSDDSYNIHFVSSSDYQLENEVKKEVLFDLSDYKMKNQQKLSDTTRKILTTPTEQRTHQEVKIIQTTLRNVKAVSDHSANVQMKIAKHGYVVRLNSKRVVVLENRVPLNFYILLAGSAVIIKRDESGNTNPISFMKRGDVFGEREILNNESWNWSVVTVDPCEFLLLDRNDYIRIFVAGGMGGLLNDPDRGVFLQNLTLFKGWPIELIKSNPNRCIFRYFKRGALLARDGVDSEWIFVIKSGSCSVVKPIEVETFTGRQIFHKLMDEQTAKFSASLQTDLVERIEKCTKEEHQQLLEEIATTIEAQKPAITSYQQMEIASLLKELNMELPNAPLTPVEEEEHENITKDLSFTRTANEDQPDSVNTALPSFRISRVSDRGAPPRTPSPMKSAYLQTGYSTPTRATTKNGVDIDGNRRTVQENMADLRSDPRNDVGHLKTQEMDAINSNTSNATFGELNVSSEDVVDGWNPNSERQKSVYINIRQLTKGNSFGLDSILFHKQPNMALVSNGAECLLLNKKFYFDNVTDEVLKQLREAEHPYPSDADLLEAYWRLLTWQFFKKRVMKEVYRRKVNSRRR